MLLTLTSLKKFVRTSWAMPRASCLSVLLSCSLKRIVGMAGFDADHWKPRGGEFMPEVRAQSAGFHADELNLGSLGANCVGYRLRAWLRHFPSHMRFPLLSTTHRWVIDCEMSSPTYSSINISVCLGCIAAVAHHRA